jgi:hypothetical protein
MVMALHILVNINDNYNIVGWLVGGLVLLFQREHILLIII